MFKQIILCAVLLYSTLAELCAQNCATCVGGDIAQCPVGTPHDVRNVDSFIYIKKLREQLFAKLF